MQLRKLFTPFFACGLLIGCADHADKIQPAYVSPLQYQDYSCKQIRGELARVSRKVNEISGVQDKTASNDSAAMGVGLILFWPALFFIDNNDQHVQLAQLKGEFDALEQVAIQNNCNVARELEEARKMEQERKEKQKAENKAQTETNK